MSKIEKYVSWMERIASDQSHGYSQQSRWGEPDYDCSSFTISALEQAGIPAKSKGATYTGNLYQVLTGIGFRDVTSSVNLSTGAGIKRGDVLMYHKQGNIGHVAVSQGNGRIVHARGKSYGSAAPGDQGTEIQKDCAYYNPGWQYVLRYAEDAKDEPDIYYIGSCTVTVAELIPGCRGPMVRTAQTLLNGKGYKGKDGKALELDGDYGENTAYAVEQLQRSAGMNGIWFGTMSSKTWELLLT